MIALYTDASSDNKLKISTIASVIWVDDAMLAEMASPYTFNSDITVAEMAAVRLGLYSLLLSDLHKYHDITCYIDNIRVVKLLNNVDHFKIAPALKVELKNVRRLAANFEHIGYTSKYPGIKNPAHQVAFDTLERYRYVYL